MGGMWGLRFSSLRVLNVKDGSRLKLVLTGTHLYKYWGTRAKVSERRTITASKFSTFCPNFRANRLYKGGKDTKQWRIHGRGPGGRGVPPPLLLNQTGARRDEKFFLETRRPTYLRLCMTFPHPPYRKVLIRHC